MAYTVETNSHLLAPNLIYTPYESPDNQSEGPEVTIGCILPDIRETHSI